MSGRQFWFVLALSAAGAGANLGATIGYAVLGNWRFSTFCACCCYLFNVRLRQLLFPELPA